MEWLYFASDACWCFGHMKQQWKTSIVQWKSHQKLSLLRFYYTRVQFRQIRTSAIKEGKSLWAKGSGWADDLRRFADEELIPDKDCVVLPYPEPFKPTEAWKRCKNLLCSCCSSIVIWLDLDCGFEFVPVSPASCRLHLHSTNGYSNCLVVSLYWRAKAPLTTTWSFGWCLGVDISLNSWGPKMSDI